jgi:hypothetical protein
MSVNKFDHEKTLKNCFAYDSSEITLYFALSALLDKGYNAARDFG